MDSDRPSLGVYLRTARTRAGLTVRELARLASIGHSYLVKLENDQKDNPSADVLQRLADAGHSVIVIEHNLDLIAEADWVIDLGPEGRDSGGQIVAEGTPEQIARNKHSHTGRFLRDLLKRG